MDRPSARNRTYRVVALVLCFLLLVNLGVVSLLAAPGPVWQVLGVVAVLGAIAVLAAMAFRKRTDS